MTATRATDSLPILLLDPDSIRVDAATYQFRSGSDAEGVTESGRYRADAWDPILHGNPLLLHQRLDGTLYVADGHHRLNLARRSKAAGQGPSKIAAVVLKETDGYTAEDARVIAAYRNMDRGNVNPIDGARIFKEAASGRVHVNLLPHLQMDKSNLRLSYRLSGLSEAALDKTAALHVPVEMAARVADIVSDPVRQENIIGIINHKLRQGYSPVAPGYQMKAPETPLSFAQRVLDGRGQGNSIALH